MTKQTSNQLAVILTSLHEPLSHYAARELQRYVRSLFGFTPPVVASGSVVEAAAVIVIRADEHAQLASQAYRLRRTEYRGRPALVVEGGSARALLWGVYEIIAQWGVRYLVQGDLMPEDPGPFRLPRLEVEREPLFAVREFRIINDMANSGVFWSLADHKRLFDQLAKLRFSGVLIATYAHHPWAHYRFGGVERRSAGLCYGWKHRIHRRTIGYELFGGQQYHTNPDFQGAQTYDELLECGQRLMSGIFAAARSRGLEVTYSHPLSEVPDEFAAPLLELSEAVELPANSIKQSHFSRHGLTFSGGTGRLEECRTPLNPVYVDLMEASLAAHIQAYPDADRYGLSEQEFPPGGAGVEECWRSLNDKYQLEKVLSLAQIKERAAKQYFYAEGRAYAQAMGAIQTLRLVDMLVNERNVLQHAAKPHAKVRLNFMSEHVQPLVAQVFPPERCEFAAIVDYLPQDVAERMSTLEFAAHSNMDVIMITTVEDDNVGFLPQMVTPSLHKIVRKMREYGLKGYCFRQFDISQHEPTMAYLVEAAWDADVLPRDSYRLYALDVAGAQANEELLGAFGGLEELTTTANSMMGLGFMFPHLYSKHWREGITVNPAWQRYVQDLKPIQQQLERAIARSRARGRALLGRHLDFIVFAREFVAALDLIRQARVAYDRAGQLRSQKSGHLEHHTWINRAADLLAEAEMSSERALRTWTKLIVDPTDLGTLAGLNAYAHDWLRGKANEIYWESQCYGMFIPQAD